MLLCHYARFSKDQSFVLHQVDCGRDGCAPRSAVGAGYHFGEASNAGVIWGDGGGISHLGCEQYVDRGWLWGGTDSKKESYLRGHILRVLFRSFHVVSHGGRARSCGTMDCFLFRYACLGTGEQSSLRDFCYLKSGRGA